MIWTVTRWRWHAKDLRRKRAAVSISALADGLWRDRKNTESLSDHSEAFSSNNIKKNQTDSTDQDVVGLISSKKEYRLDDFCFFTHLKVKIAFLDSRLLSSFYRGYETGQFPAPFSRCIF